MATPPLSVAQLVDQLLGPLIVGDGGELFVLRADERQLEIHLRGSFSGCPGNTLVIRRIIEPLLTKIEPQCRLVVTSGELVPTHATQWTAVQTTALRD